MIQVAVFTCARDREKAELATRTIPKDWPVAWVLDACDEQMAVPAGVEKIVIAFSRGRHLDTPQACWGVAKVLSELATRYGRVAKVDSDCLLIDPSFLLKGDLAGMPYLGMNGAVYGMCYALTAAPARRAFDAIVDGFKKEIYPLAEDMAITTLAKAGGGLVPQGSLWDSDFRSMPPKGTLAVHCGCVYKTRRDGPGCANEMRRLGDALGIWRRP